MPCRKKLSPKQRKHLRSLRKVKQRRRFGDKLYTLDRTSKNKTKAKERAETLREQGYLVRIVPSESQKPKHRVYKRKKR